MNDPLEGVRQARLAEINSTTRSRAELEAVYGQVWDADDLARDFTVSGFLAPYVVVHRKSDGVLGSLEFQHCPRFYFNFTADR